MQSQKPFNLTEHGVKQLSESLEVPKDFSSTFMIFQVVEVNIFDEHEKKKNIKARVNLSDGHSKMTTMVTDKIY